MWEAAAFQTGLKDAIAAIVAWLAYQIQRAVIRA